jgi:O-antigen/teichoic acid export membrane protein
MLRSVLKRATEDRSTRASALYVSSGILVQSVALVLSPLWTRAMSKAEYGIIAVVQSIAILVATTAGLGLQNGVARLVHDEPRGSRAQLDTAKSIITFQFAVLAGVLVVSVVSIRLFEERLDDLLGFNAKPYLDLAMLGGFLAAVASTLTRASQSFESPWPVFWSRLVETLSGGALILLLVVSRGMQGAGMLIARAVSAGCVVLFMVIGVRRLAKGRIQPGVVRTALKFSLPLLPYQVTALVLDGADRLILNEFHGEASVAPYALAYALGGGAILLVGNSLVHAEAPAFYQAVRESNHALAGRRVIRGIQVLALTAVGVNVVGGPAIRLIYDARYTSSAALLPLIASGLFFWGVFSFKNLTLLAQKRSGVSSAITVATAVTNVALNFAMIPTWGAAGAAVATLIAYALQAVAGIVAERSLAPVPQHLGRLAACAAGVVISSILAYGFIRS